MLISDFRLGPIRTWREPSVKIYSKLPHSRLLLSSLHSSKIARPVLHIELYIDLPSEVCASVVQGSSLHTGDVGHDFQFGIQARPAGRAEEVFVNLATSTSGVVRRRGPYNLIRLVTRVTVR